MNGPFYFDTTKFYGTSKQNRFCKVNKIDSVKQTTKNKHKTKTKQNKTNRKTNMQMILLCSVIRG